MNDVCKNTVEQIFEANDQLVEQLMELRNENGGVQKVIFYFKYGSDGSQGHPIFKQILDAERYQGAVYATGMVPMQLVVFLSNGRKEILYNNVLVNSSLSWRPLRILFKKESTELIKDEKARLDSERAQLQDIEILDGITITFKGIYSMNDMKESVWKCPKKSSLYRFYCFAPFYFPYSDCSHLSQCSLFSFCFAYSTHSVHGVWKSQISLIQSCKQSELRLQFECTIIDKKCEKKVNFGEF